MDIPTCDSLADLARLTRQSGALYVRYSRGPEEDCDGRVSRDYESGLELPGLSANPLAPASWWTRPLEDWLARQVRMYAHLKDDADDHRCASVLTGTVAERGPDNEPLLVDVTPVAVLSEELLREAQKRYQDRFQIGASSTDGDARPALDEH